MQCYVSFDTLPVSIFPVHHDGSGSFLSGESAGFNLFVAGKLALHVRL